MRLACYNVENLFARAKALNQDKVSDGQRVLDDFAAFNALIGNPVYSDADKTEMVRLLTRLDLVTDDESAFVRLRKNRGTFLVRRRPDRTNRKKVVLDIQAKGRGDWTGWLELEREPVDDQAMRLTARVIAEVNADVIGIVEAENRPALKGFSDDILPLENGAPYDQVMLIDGNDPRGIDCAIMTRTDYPIISMRSHVDLRDKTGIVFSRDCAEYRLAAPGGKRLTVLVNHLKSRMGAQAASNAKRRRQAEAIAEIYRRLRARGHANIAVIGDLNDTPPDDPADPLSPLLDGTDLTDIASLPGHQDGGRPGTFGSSLPNDKIDYILLSPELRARATASGIFRKGMWPGVRPRKWDVYPEIDPLLDGDPKHVASDHAALWVDLDLER